MGGWAVASFALAGLCIVSSLAQRPLWRVTQSWKYKEPDRAELRDEIYFFRSVVAAVMAIVFVGIGIWILANQDRFECERTMSRLEGAAEDVDFQEGEDFAVDEDMYDDISARTTLERIAEDEDARLVDRNDEIDVVRDGERLGTLTELGSTRRCG
jgi:hypothetical protein